MRKEVVRSDFEIAKSSRNRCQRESTNRLKKTAPKMRFIMKGGVWKNTEDEILKAAVMKYGLTLFFSRCSVETRFSSACAHQAKISGGEFRPCLSERLRNSAKLVGTSGLTRR